MLSEKLIEVIKHPSDGIIAIVTQGTLEPHVVNSWNSYVNITNEGKLLIPVAGMKETEANIEKNNKVHLTIGNRQVQGKMYAGTGFLIKGTAKFLKSGSDFDKTKDTFDWIRAVLEITVDSAEQTL